MSWQTKVDIAPLQERIGYTEKISLVGSCFASEIGERLLALRFDVMVNPFGVLYNPGSITASLERLESGTPFSERDLIRCGDIYKSFTHGSEFAAMSEEEFLSKNNAILKKSSDHYRASEWIVVSLGTSWVYRRKESGEIVSNCHKLPASLFEREIMEEARTVDLLSSRIEKSPDKKWIFTVSPIRHWKDGAVGNQRSKAKLLLAVESLQRRYENVYYFPVYEIFMDELRDYRFYAADMLHPSVTAVDYIWEKFRYFAIDNSCEKRMRKISALNAMNSHRPVFPESGEYRDFLKKRDELAREIEMG